MLTHPTIDRLRELGLAGMVRALEELHRQPDSNELSFDDRLALLVDREVLERDNRRLKTRLRFAGLRQTAAPEDVDYRAHRGLEVHDARHAAGDMLDRDRIRIREHLRQGRDVGEPRRMESLAIVPAELRVERAQQREQTVERLARGVRVLV